MAAEKTIEWFRNYGHLLPDDLQDSTQSDWENRVLAHVKTWAETEGSGTEAAFPGDPPAARAAPILVSDEELAQIERDIQEQDEKFYGWLAQDEDRKLRFPLVYADSVDPVLDISDFVEDLLCHKELSVIYGESNCGKTFFMLDLAMHVAMGMKWRGKEVQQGGVIYAALEGGQGTRNRVVAFRQHHQIKDHIPLAIIPSSINFLDAKGDIEGLIDAIEEAANKIGAVRMVVIDTLARAMAGGDENGAEDMGQLIINADRIRAVTGAHIAFIHHSGKDALKGARGHSSLRAAVDTEIEISRADEKAPSKIKVVKQREMAMLEDMSFSLSRIVLGKNGRGKEVSSCVVLPAELPERKTVVALTSHEKFVYEALLQASIEYGQMRSVYKDAPPVKAVDYFQLAKALEDAGYKELLKDDGTNTVNQATLVARLGLKKKGYVGFNSGFLWVNKEYE